MKKALSPLLVLLNKLVHERGDRAVEATGLLNPVNQIDFKFSNFLLYPTLCLKE